jgi:hypothetical protein
VTEYKSSFPDQAWPGAAEIVETLRRQAQLYAAIIADAGGTWPAHARIVAASGQVIEFAIDPAACNAEADAALSALERIEAGPDGDLYTVYILTRLSCNQLIGDQPVVLRQSAHGSLPASAVGAQCRIVGGRIRPDGRVRADLSTIAFSISELPILKNAVSQRAPSKWLATERSKPA